LTLEIAGLRSYRGRTPIDFPQEGGLIGVIGDTGSGKSSILEAMVAALYARTSWKRGDLSDLRNSSEETMRIVFTFEVDGKRWRVTRTSSRKNYPPSVHELECLDEADEIYSGKTEVTDKVVELIGLDYDAFKSTVILPQGNFERLLKASEAERIDILMSILRLDQLHTVREKAVESQLGLVKLVGRAEIVRAGFGNPEQDAVDAAKNLAEARARRDVLRGVAAEIGSTEKCRASANDRLVHLRASASGLDNVPAESSAALSVLADTLESIEVDREALVERQRSEQATADSIRAQLDAATANGETVEVLGAARAVLEARVRELPELEATRADLAARTAGVARQTAELTGLREVSDAARLAAEAAQQQADTAASRLTDFGERCQAAVTAVDHVRASATSLALAEQNREAATSKLGPAQLALAAATSQLEQARTTEQRAAAELLDVQRHDHAAAAAAGLVGGDPCPVCTRALPAEFTAPAPTAAVSAATSRHDAAREATIAAVSAESTARHALQTAESDIENAECALVEAADRFASDRASLREYVDAEPDLKLQTPAILKELFDEQARLTAERDRSQKDARAAGIESTRRETALLLAEQAIDTEKAAIATTAQALDTRRATLEVARELLPAAFRPREDDDEVAIQGLLGQLQTRLGELSALAAARDDAAKAATAAGRDLAIVLERRRTEVDVPLNALLRSLSTLADRAATAAALLNTTPPCPVDERLAVPALGVAAAQLEHAAAELRAALGVAIVETETELRTSAARIEELLASLDLETADQLQQALEAASGDVLRWQAAEQQARDLIEPARQLDCAIAPVRDRTTALDEVATLLQRNAFIKEVAERRQQALLGHASRILLSMTNQRYGFDRKFAIADTLTGVARKVDTLSGGETFLASLALALGLVEVARSSGGRLDAIFLDEGFGSLDQAALDQAIAALDSAAVEGRTVGVVTHVRRVMDNIDRILAVTRTPEGSRAVWLDARERESLVEHDVAAGMLA
jgi:exonuclease SbcC